MIAKKLLAATAVVSVCASVGLAMPLAGMIAPSVTLALMGPEAKEPKKTAPKQKVKLKVGDVAPAFSLKSPDGKTVTLESLKGKIVVVDFWATWCGPCKRAMPKIQALHEEFKDQGVVVYGIQTWEDDHDKAVKYMKDSKYTYGLLHGNDTTAEAYGLGGIPAIFVISPEGKILFATEGLSPGGETKLHETVQAAAADLKKSKGGA